MSQIQKSVELLAETLQGKNQDYAGGRGEFYNFEAASQFGGRDNDPFSVVLSQLAIKVTRLDSLAFKVTRVTDESLKDTLLDLAGYALIAHAMLSREVFEGAKPRMSFHSGALDQTWNPAG